MHKPHYASKSGNEVNSNYELNTPPAREAEPQTFLPSKMNICSFVLAAVGHKEIMDRSTTWDALATAYEQKEAKQFQN